MKISNFLLLQVLFYLLTGSAGAQNSQKNNWLSFGEIFHFCDEAAFMSVDFISDDRVIVVYRDWSNEGKGTAIIGSTGNMGIGFSDPFVFSASNIFLPKVRFVNDSVFVIVYRDMGQSGKGMIIRGVIENDSLLFGSPLTFSSGMISTSSLIFMDAHSFVVAYKDNNNNGFGTLRTGTIENGSISLGQEFLYNESTSFENVLTHLTDTTFIITYRNMGNGEAGTVRGGFFDNGTVTFTDPLVFSSSQATDISVAALTSTGFVISYSKAAQTGEAVYGFFEAGSLLFTGPFVFCNNEVAGTSVTCINDSIAVISFADELNSGAGSAIVAGIYSNEILYSEKVLFNSAGSYNLAGAKISDSSLLLAFRNVGNNYSGSAVTGTVHFDPLTGNNISFVCNEYKVYPNPAQGFIIVEGNDIECIELLNNKGQALKTITIPESKTRIDLHDLLNGIYFLKIIAKEGTEIQKIILE